VAKVKNHFCKVQVWPLNGFQLFS